MKIEDLFSVKGKIALVTGGSRGLGEMIARAYVENGAKVYITARRADACMALAEELSQIGECIAIPADLSRMEEIERFSAELHKREKKLDILVNNAGASWGAPFPEFPENGWDKVMDLNVKSVFFLTQKSSRSAGGGRIEEGLFAGHQHRVDRGHPNIASRSLFVCGVESGGQSPHAHHGEVPRAEIHRGQRDCARLFPIEDDRRDR